MRSTAGEIARGNETVGRQVSGFKRVRAKICEHCPFCIHARNNLDSPIGRVLHHRFHSDHCPLWTAYRDVHGQTMDSKTATSMKTTEC